MAAFNPLDYPACLSYPARLPARADDSAHLPFMMFLVDLLRPKVFVEIGTEDGASYCACCQVVKNLGLDTRCYSINAGGQPEAPDFAELKQYHDSLYGRFSKLALHTSEAALTDFEDRTIDLLYIREERSYEVVKHLYRTWLPKMSGRGAIILRGIGAREHDGAGRLWEEIEPSHTHFELPSGNGLGVISVSHHEASPLLPLARLSKEDHSLLILFFQELGERLNIHLKKERRIKGLILESEKKEEELRSLSSQLRNSLEDREAVARAWQTNYQTVLRKWGSKQKEMVEDKARAIQTLSATLTNERNRKQQLLTESQVMSDKLTATAARLDSILGSRAWRWVTRYGRVKATLLAPINRLFNHKV